MTLVYEKGFAQAVVELARAMGWKVWWTWRSTHSPEGEPDLRMVHPILRRVVWAELKSQRGKLTAAQTEAIQILHDAGAEIYVWKPSDWPEIERVLKGNPAISEEGA